MARQAITSMSPRTRKAALRDDLERRIAHVAAELEDARAHLHEAQEAVHAAEDTLIARRLDCEAVALHIAELAELLESLQN
jgi:chromosome segregation ATPase